jgi:hypothetical protein
MFTQNEIDFVKSAYAAIGREFVHEPRVISLDDGESSVLDFDWFSVVRYPVAFKDIGVVESPRYDVNVWNERTGYGGYPEIVEVELASGLSSIQAALVECFVSDEKARIEREIYALPFERRFGEV